MKDFIIKTFLAFLIISVVIPQLKEWYMTHLAYREIRLVFPSKPGSYVAAPNRPSTESDDEVLRPRFNLISVVEE